MHRNEPLVLAVVIASLTLTAVAPGSSFISELVPSSSDDADIGATGGSPSTPETDSDPRGSPTDSTEATASRARIASASRQPLSDARSLPSVNGGSVPLRADSPEVRSGSHTSLPVASPSASSSPPTLVPESLALRNGRRPSLATGPSSASASPPPSQPTAVSSPRSAPPSMSPPPPAGIRAPRRPTRSPTSGLRELPPLPRRPLGPVRDRRERLDRPIRARSPASCRRRRRHPNARSVTVRRTPPPIRKVVEFPLD